MGERALLNRIAKIKELEAKAKELEKEIEEVKEAIKEDMEAKNVDEIKAGDFTIRYKEIETSRFDSTTFKKTYEELYKKFLKTTKSMRFSIN